MLASAIWLTALILEAVLLVRAIQGAFLRRYLLFYLYLCSVLLIDLTIFPVYRWFPRAYPYAYWYSQFFLVASGCAVVWEIYRVALKPYPGAARMAKNVLAFLFVVSFSRIVVKAWTDPRGFPGGTTLETERDLRVVQSALLLGLVALLSYYAVPVGKNLKGMILGFGVFLGTSLVNLTARSYFGETFQKAWLYIQPLSYLAVLGIWVVTLWSYAPAPEPPAESRLEVSYQTLLASTRRRFASTRTRVARAIRP